MAEEAASVTGKELATRIGCKPSYVVELKRNGRVVPGPNGRGYLLAESLALYEATRDPAKAAVASRHAQARGTGTLGSDEGEEEGDAPDAEQLPASPDAKRKAKALADKAEFDAKAAQRDYEVSMGKLLDADQVQHALAAAATQLRTTLERLPDTLAPQLVAMSDEGKARNLMWDEINHALEEASRAFRRIAQAGTA